MVHSICRAPAIAPAKLLAVDSPRSFWQCVEKTTLSAPGVLAMRSAMRPPNSCGKFQPALPEQVGFLQESALGEIVVEKTDGDGD